MTRRNVRIEIHRPRCWRPASSRSSFRACDRQRARFQPGQWVNLVLARPERARSGAPTRLPRRPTGPPTSKSRSPRSAEGRAPATSAGSGRAPGCAPSVRKVSSRAIPGDAAPALFVATGTGRDAASLDAASGRAIGARRRPSGSCSAFAATSESLVPRRARNAGSRRSRNFRAFFTLSQGEPSGPGAAATCKRTSPMLWAELTDARKRRAAHLRLRARAHGHRGAPSRAKRDGRSPASACTPSDTTDALSNPCAPPRADPARSRGWRSRPGKSRCGRAPRERESRRRPLRGTSCRRPCRARRPSR